MPLGNIFYSETPPWFTPRLPRQRWLLRRLRRWFAQSPEPPGAPPPHAGRRGSGHGHRRRCQAATQRQLARCRWRRAAARGRPVGRRCQPRPRPPPPPPPTFGPSRQRGWGRELLRICPIGLLRAVDTSVDCAAPAEPQPSGSCPLKGPLGDGRPVPSAKGVDGRLRGENVELMWSGGERRWMNVMRESPGDWGFYSWPEDWGFWVLRRAEQEACAVARERARRHCINTSWSRRVAIGDACAVGRRVRSHRREHVDKAREKTMGRRVYTRFLFSTHVRCKLHCT